MAGQLTIDTLKASSGVLATQNGMTGIAKAWVNFGGTNTIAGSFNVSSITYVSTGTYTVNFTTAMANANYSCLTGGAQFAAFPAAGQSTSSYNYTTTSVKVVSDWNNGNVHDAVVFSVAIFGA